MSTIKVPVLTRCARCGLNHTDVIFSELNHPLGDYRWWATCPINGQPILLRQASEREAKDATKNQVETFISPDSYEILDGFEPDFNPDGAESG